MRVVVDTNVLVSAFLSPLGNPKKVLDLILLGEAFLLYDERIFSEYREVLKRQELGLPQKEVEEVFSFLLQEGELVIPKPLPFKLPDPDDLPFLEVAVAGQAQFLITGNRKHFPKQPVHAIPILTPSEFIARLHKTDDL